MKIKSFVTTLLSTAVLFTCSGSIYAEGWTDTIKLKGDVRFRYQTEEKDSSDVSRDRYRVRARAEISAKRMKIGKQQSALQQEGMIPGQPTHPGQPVFFNWRGSGLCIYQVQSQQNVQHNGRQDKKPHLGNKGSFVGR